MNLHNLNKVLAWLEAGAPHVAFNMAFASADDEYYTREQNESIEQLRVRTGQVPEPECGTVCCIGGAAFLMAHAPEGQLFPSLEVQHQLDISTPHWDTIMDEALSFLGLPFQPGHPLGHSLFDPRLAPENCTPAQAAQALRNVMEGREPWN